MKLLESGVEAIQEDISKCLSKKLSEYDFTLTKEMAKREDTWFGYIINKCIDDDNLFNL